MSRTKEPKQKRPISSSAVVRIVIWSVVLVILLSIFAVLILQSVFNYGFNITAGFSMGGYRYDDADEYNVGAGTSSQSVNELEIDWLAGDIEILPTDENTITIRDTYTGDNDDDRMRWRIEDGELSIKYCAPYWAFGFKKTARKDLTVHIPRTMLESMDEVAIDSLESRVTFAGNARELSVDGVEYDLTVTGRIGELDVDAVEGKLTLYGSVDHVDMDGVEGKAFLHVDQAARVDVDGVESEVTLYLADTVKGFRVETSGIGTRVQVDGFTDVQKNEDLTTWGDGSLRVNADGVSVSVTIAKAPAPTSPETTLETAP